MIMNAELASILKEAILAYLGRRFSYMMYPVFSKQNARP
jgi:hypothetical protein